MKKIIIIAALLSALPAFSACSITGGACSIFDSQSLKDQMVPNRLQDMQRTDAFQRDLIKPYDEIMLNTTPAENRNSSNYNSNCQFGICLPGENNVQE